VDTILHSCVLEMKVTLVSLSHPFVNAQQCLKVPPSLPVTDVPIDVSSILKNLQDTVTLSPTTITDKTPNTLPATWLHVLVCPAECWSSVLGQQQHQQSDPHTGLLQQGHVSPLVVAESSENALL
jgi:hypothetical protein